MRSREARKGTANSSCVPGLARVVLGPRLGLGPHGREAPPRQTARTLGGMVARQAVGRGRASRQGVPRQSLGTRASGCVCLLQEGDVMSDPEHHPQAPPETPSPGPRSWLDDLVSWSDPEWLLSVGFLLLPALLCTALGMFQRASF